MNRALFIGFLLLALCPLAWGRGGGGCFEEGTPVLTPHGEVPIEQLCVGDEVCTATGVGRVESVLQVEPAEYLEWQDGERKLRVTAEHPFQLTPGVFLTAEHFLANARRISAVRPAYNLLVQPGGTFWVNGWVVHNKGCFLPDTSILKTDGTEIAIRDVQCGDELMAFTTDGVVVQTTVRNILTHDVEDYLVLTTDKIEVRVTLEHPFYVGNGMFKTVEALRTGDVVFVFDGAGLSPQRITSLKAVHQPVRVYNLQTDTPNTFFAQGIAVHNKGGGGGFGGGGGYYHSSSGYGHSSGTAMSDPETKVFFIFLGVVAGVIILIMVVQQARKKDENLDFSYSDEAVEAKAAKTAKLLEFISRVDASCEAATLAGRAREVFLKLQECWQAREYAEMEPLLMPDLYREHCQQLASLRRNHEINMIEDPRVERVTIVNIRYTQKPEQREFTALIGASARDYYTDDRTGDFLRGDESAAAFQEFWTFHYQGGQWLLREIEQSRESDALKTDNFFEAFTDAGVDHVYAETAGKEGPAGPWLPKEVETKATRTERLLNFLVQTDKLWDQTTMLERARKIFMDVLLAREAGDPAIVLADLFPGVAASLQNEIQRRQMEGSGIEYRNLCVRKVELVLVRNYADNAQDEFVTRISAHAQRAVTQEGAVVGQDEFVTPFVEFWTFGRLDNQWKLKEVLPEASGESLVGQENVDEDSNAEKMEWYYRHKRAT